MISAAVIAWAHCSGMTEDETQSDWLIELISLNEVAFCPSFARTFEQLLDLTLRKTLLCVCISPWALDFAREMGSFAASARFKQLIEQLVAENAAWFCFSNLLKTSPLGDSDFSPAQHVNHMTHYLGVWSREVVKELEGSAWLSCTLLQWLRSLKFNDWRRPMRSCSMNFKNQKFLDLPLVRTEPAPLCLHRDVRVLMSLRRPQLGALRNVCFPSARFC